MDSNSCPECGKRIFRDDFQCAHCGLLLHPEQASGEYVLTDPAIVRALLSPNQPRSDTEEFFFPDGEYIPPAVTGVYPVALLGDDCPQLVTGLDVALTPLQPYEAHVAAYIDGESTLEQLAKASAVPLVEVRAVISSLLARGIVQIEREKQQQKKKAEPAPAIEDVPTNRRARPKAVRPPAAVKPPSPPKPRFSEALDKLHSPEESKEQNRFGLYGRSAVEKALEEAKARKNAPLQERSAVLLDSPEEFLQRAISLERQGQVDGAIYVLKRAIERVRKPGPIYNKLALILLNQRKDYRQAEELLRRAVKSEPGNTVYQQNLYTVLTLAAEEQSGKKDAGGLWAKLRGK